MAPERTRLSVALAVATSLHLAFAWFARELPLSSLPQVPRPAPTPLRLVELPRPTPSRPEPALVPEEVAPPGSSVDSQRSPRAQRRPSPKEPVVVEVSPEVRSSPASVVPPSPEGLSPSQVALEHSVDNSLRLPPVPRSALDRVFGKGDGVLSPSLRDLEVGLAYRAEGPISDKARAEKTARRLLEDALAEEAMDAGLVDDYFRELSRHIEGAWRPARRELNDGGDRTTQAGFLRDFGQNPQAMGEMWELYLDLARQYAQGEKPHIEQKRLERLREVMRSRKGNFRFHAITEAEVTHAADGQILTVELPLSSGHPSFDEGVRDAIVVGVRAMTGPPPAALSRGRPFRSRWRLRATWKMIPPTALLSGNSFDLTSKGLEVDVPFEVQLKTRVMLRSFDNREHTLRHRR